MGVLKTEEQKNAESAGQFMERLDESMKKKGDLWLRDEEEEDKVSARAQAPTAGGTGAVRKLPSFRVQSQT